MARFTTIKAGMTALVLAGVLAGGTVAGVAQGATAISNHGTVDRDANTSLVLSTGHPAYVFNIFAQDTRGSSAKETTYSVWMYDTSGRLVWSAQNQRNRNYNTGSNVKRIDIRRTCGCKGITGISRR